jgi:DNA-binding protein YbaB
MFEKLKQIKDLRAQAKTMQNALSGESASVEKNGVKITINGNLEITELTIAEGAGAATVKDAANEAIKKVQKIIAQKMQDMGGLKNFGL